MSTARLLAGDAGRGLLIVADHASNALPDGIDPGIDAIHLARHIAFDIGTEALAIALAKQLHASAVLASVSRLVVDLNRIAADAIPVRSDDVSLTGNAVLDAEAKAERIARYHEPYHRTIAENLEGVRLVVSLHSFTPALTSAPDAQRPWHVGLLYNKDGRAARLAIPLLAAQGLTVGDNEPYSGALYGYTMDRHAEANGIAYLTFEIRQDLLADAEAITRWTALLGRIIEQVEAELFTEARGAIA